ncbi:MAG: flagellar hook protein FlgE [Dehalococcoidia bacterium]
MFAAIAGLRNHITYMDVVGNNIANVNTTAFKASRVTFQDMMSQTQTGASAPTENRGGTNPIQVGLGMTLGGVDVLQAQGSLQSTGKLTDFAIQGNGFFILRDGAREFYSRDGAFDVAVSGEMVNPTNGFKVQGWSADPSGAIDVTSPVGAINIPFGQAIAAQPTTDVTFAGNLDARLATGATIATTVDIFDSLGAAHPVTVTFTKNAAPNTWDIATSSSDTNVTGVVPAPAQIVFDNAGVLQTPAAPTPLALTTTLAAASGAGSPVTSDIKISSITQFATSGQMSATFNNGYSAGSLVSFSVGPGGDITGIFSNGTNRPLGQMAMALFTNAGGLQRAGANNFEATSNSGIPIIGTPGTGGRGSVGTGVLEGSNTDLAREFTNVVMAQRGFQASSKVISTADEILQDLVNLKR